MEDHWVFGRCDWNSIPFLLLYHAQRVPGSVNLWPSSQRLLLSSPQQVCLIYCVVVERRVLQSITCDVRTSRRPVLHSNIFTRRHSVI